MIQNSSSIFDTTLIENLLQTTGDSGLIIGKAKTMYTLYSYSIADTKNFDNEHHFYTVTCGFEKIVAKTLDKVKKLYPALSINENLHGKWISEKINTKKSNPTGETHTMTGNIPCDYFQFGQYKGKKFTECNDIGYLCWYYNKLNWTDPESAMFRATLTHILENTTAVPYMGSYYKHMTPMIFKLKAITDNCVDNNCEPFTWECKCSPDTAGVLPMLDGVVMKFNNYTVNSTRYGTSVYVKPTANDNGKRIKGKKILVKKYRFVNNMKDKSNIETADYRFWSKWDLYPILSNAEFIVDEFDIIK